MESLLADGPGHARIARVRDRSPERVCNLSAARRAQPTDAGGQQ